MDSDSLLAFALLLLGLAGAAFGAAASAALPPPARGRRLSNGERTAMEWAVRQRSVLGLTTLAVSAGGVALTCGAVAWLLYHGLLTSWPNVFADRKSTRLNSSHIQKSRMPSSA